MTFETLKLASPLMTRLKQLNYTKPTEIQKKAIPLILSGKDVLAAAQTGTGKTAAFGLPILHKLSQEKNTQGTSIRALILAPTRELAAQIGEAIEEYAKDLTVSIAVVFGGVKIKPQITRLKKGVDVLVATPGRLLDLYKQNTVSFSQCKYVVLDEADRMLDMGFVHDIRRIFSALPKKRQTMLFSATFSKPIQALANNFVYNSVAISATPPNSTAELINQLVYPVDQKRKPSLLAHLIHKESWDQVLVFTRTKHGANKLVTQLENEGIVTAAIHGNKSQSARKKALDDFKSGEIRVLVATDIAARGLDIHQLPVAVNYDLPQAAEDYVHRIGRTGRAGCEGQAISLVCFEEYSKLLDIEKLIKKTLPRKSLENFLISKELPISHLNRKKVSPIKKRQSNRVDKNKNSKIYNKENKRTWFIGRKKKAIA